MAAMTSDVQLNEKKDEVKMVLSQVKSIITEIIENKQASAHGIAKFPPEKYPLLWFIGFENDEDGNAMANDMLIAIKKGKIDIKYENYWGVQGRYLHLYFGESRTFKDYLPKVMDSDPVLVRMLDGKRERFTIEKFESLSAKIFETVESERRTG